MALTTNKENKTKKNVYFNEVLAITMKYNNERQNFKDT